MFHTTICDMLGIRYPILQGAMQRVGGPDLVAAVGDAGGLGILPTFGGTEERLRQDITDTRARTDKPFAVNITPMGQGFTKSRVAIILDMGVKIVTTGRADPGKDIVRVLKDAGVIVMSVVPTVAHAKRMEEEGADAIIASGGEAGGHVGTISTMPLIPQVVDAVKVPVLAAGGIGDARGFLAALALGAVGVQIGTRFMATQETDLNKWGVQKLLEMNETDTIVSKARTGAPVRCIRTPELVAYEDARAAGEPDDILTELRRKARDDRNGPKEEQHQAAAGQIAGLIHDTPPVASIIDGIITGAAEISQSLLKTANA
ncbi:MAG: enoyl-[acyl-carrier-protein] reductase FabK [Rhodospirillaceae bacterium]|jgi:enoyl-[acyl-carrier protein] reductase II|nr:enoyl-[acyl-carrier-protein] reductase FabK [Rhodospirillaceae bacterium]MBT5809302.1 enoyl-[acyl-carrier-protein] reductase FabK [Rhodospirillaceae bacterium]